jgi:two-component system chemotaxis response regulator CheY
MKRILIVDDAAFMRLQIRTMLDKNGYTIVGEAKDGEDAVEKYKRLKPDIITLDITMPIMNGVEALKQIMEFDKNANVLIISAIGLEHIVVKTVLLGAKGFIIKPFDEKKLIDSLDKITLFQREY